jgi:hypothetical protein
MAARLARARKRECVRWRSLGKVTCEERSPRYCREAVEEGTGWQSGPEKVLVGLRGAKEA